MIIKGKKKIFAYYLMKIVEMVQSERITNVLLIGE
jgi:hypothetical protein